MTEVSKGASVTRRMGSDFTSASSVFEQDSDHASQSPNNSFENVRLSPDYQIVRFIRSESHGDLYLLAALGSSDKKYVAKAINSRDCTPKLRRHRQKHLKRLKSSSSFICVLEEHGMMWVVRHCDEPEVVGSDIASRHRAIEAEWLGPSGVFPLYQEIDMLTARIEEASVSSASGLRSRCCLTDTDPLPDGNCTNGTFPESTVTRVGSSPMLNEDDHPVSDEAQNHDHVGSMGDASPTPFWDLFEEAEASSDVEISQQDKAIIRKQAGKARWRKIQRYRRQLHRLSLPPTATFLPRKAPVQLLIPGPAVEVLDGGKQGGDERPANPLSRVYNGYRYGGACLISSSFWTNLDGSFSHRYVLLWDGGESIADFIPLFAEIQKCTICELLKEVTGKDHWAERKLVFSVDFDVGQRSKRLLFLNSGKWTLHESEGR
ncbi:dihydroorotate dehydrogenase (fumarate) [Fonsecaea nubica]|uniref:Dihydroorotate dehydrogenase (Fumarate) n=1 Tax=Fonsecaea nubica TaxID=856822 RepID=A0A178BVU2_9EURO|nr:dihydroorotate dehydrogenase (fumarate) [Fonsecaea nubica]OAL21022.1 dihydroorotate dehydrogenase (fumarate) [Fonsecaea nubica]